MLVAASSASSAAGEDAVAVAVSGTEGAAGPLGSFVVVGYFA